MQWAGATCIGLAFPAHCRLLTAHSPMIHYFKFRQDLFDPTPARDAYHKRQPGKGWPEECPPIRAANSFGFDILANFDVTFVQRKPTKADACPWRAEPDTVIQSDFDWSPSEDVEGAPL